MKLTIHKHSHRPAWWFLFLRLWYNKKIIRRQFTLSFDCKYDLGDNDQDDHNKLFGIGYFPSQHTDSARIGWRYDTNKEKFILSAYCYANGVRSMKVLCEVFANKPYLASITKSALYYNFLVMQKDTKIIVGSESVYYGHKKKWCFYLGLYFGGNKTAPHNMTVELKKY